MGVGGATADDADQEMIKNIIETEIVGMCLSYDRANCV